MPINRAASSQTDIILIFLFLIEDNELMQKIHWHIKISICKRHSIKNVTKKDLQFKKKKYIFCTVNAVEWLIN